MASWCIDPVATHDLRTGVNLRKPFLLKFREIFYCAGVVAKEICPADAVLVAEREVNFSDHIINVDVVVESVRNANALRVVRRKSRAITGDGWAREIAACNLKACRVDAETTVVPR
jgi:hypothetical protein